ncbi:MAG: DUF1801 domain-containing protein [Pseudomonadota bacterium]
MALDTWQEEVSPAFADAEVAAAFAAFSEEVRPGLLSLRRLIFETAATTPGVGRLQETLKWGEPAYLTAESKSGSTLRLGPAKQGGFALYAHCQTTIISDFRALFPDDFHFEGNRAVRFHAAAPLPQEKLRLLIASALTYHLNKRRG